MPRLAIVRLPALLVLLAVSLLRQPSGHAQEAAQPAPRPTLHLHAESLPYYHFTHGDFPYRLSRELVRQAILIAARDGMHVATRDATLHEALPAAGEVVEIFPIERGTAFGKWKLKLLQPQEGVDPHEIEPLWSKTYDYEAIAAKMYADMTPKLEADSRGALIEGLKAAGLPPGPAPKPAVADDEAAQKQLAEELAAIDKMLLKVDFITQFAAVRAAHDAIARYGEQPALLECLARGYANLGMLTHHQWNTSSEVFTARAWLYAQRLVAQQPDNERALWHRAYAWAMTGVHQHALEDIELIAALDKPSEDGSAATASAAPAARPAWADLTVALCHCDRQAITEFGGAHKDWRPWAAQLHFQLTDIFSVADWSFESAHGVVEVAPTAYGVYAALAHHGGTLGATRTGASLAPQAWRRYSAASLTKIPNLPSEIKDILPSDAAKQAALRERLHDPDPNDLFSPGPNFIAGELRNYTQQHADAEPSWSALAFLMEDEQFCQAVNFLHVSLNGTEQSLAPVVDAIRPFMKDHRLAAFVDSYRYNGISDSAEYHGSLANLKVDDPRRNMQPLLHRTWNTPTAQVKQFGRELDYNTHRNFTLPGMFEAYATYATWKAKERGFMRMIGKEYSAIAPHAEIGTRVLIEFADKPTAEQLQAWEDKIKEDPYAFMYLGDWHVKGEQQEAAIRCFEKSLAIHPTFDVTKKLADLYYKAKQFDKWAAELNKSLETDDLGLGHAAIHQEFAHGYIKRGDWATAKPHALEAAQTYAAWGLELAGQVCEALGDWEESEQMYRTVSEQYPTAYADRWYHWCRRTGRGDLDGARSLAQTMYDIAHYPTYATLVSTGAYRLLEEDLEAALAQYVQAYGVRKSFNCTMMISQIARELGDDAQHAEIIADFKAYVASQQDNPNYGKQVDEVGLAILEVMESDEISDEQLAKIEKLLQVTDPQTRCSFAYILAGELDRLGKTDEARKYWRRAMAIPFPDWDYATLSGYRLAKLDGTSRPDGDALGSDDIWPALAADELAEEGAEAKSDDEK